MFCFQSVPWQTKEGARRASTPVGRREGWGVPHLERLVQEGGGVAGGHAHEDEEQQRGRHQPAAVGGREEAEHRAEDADDRHREQLHAGAERRAEEDRVWRRPEDVGVDELPAGLLL